MTVSGSVDGKFDQFNFQSLCINQYQFAGLVESWKRNDTDLLSHGAFNEHGIKFGLIAHKKKVRALVDDKLIFLLEWVAPLRYCISTVDLDE